MWNCATATGINFVPGCTFRPMQLAEIRCRRTGNDLGVGYALPVATIGWKADVPAMLERLSGEVDQICLLTEPFPSDLMALK